MKTKGKQLKALVEVLRRASLKLEGVDITRGHAGNGTANSLIVTHSDGEAITIGPRGGIT